MSAANTYARTMLRVGWLVGSGLTALLSQKGYIVPRIIIATV